MTTIKSAERKLQADWRRIAKEPIEVSYVKGTFYGFGSELAVLRLFHEYNKVTRNKNTRVVYSTQIGSWTFSLETRLRLED